MSDASSGDQYTAAWGTPGPSPAPEPPTERPVLEAEPMVDATPWWEAVCTELAAGRAVDPTRVGLVVQLQAQHFARQERQASEAGVRRQPPPGLWFRVDLRKIYSY
eukprot:SAG31_NODE_773_length_12173_cov_15.778173_4_plen_106_part_00